MSDAQNELKRNRSWRNAYVSHMESTRIKEIARQSAVDFKIANGESSTGSDFLDLVREVVSNNIPTNSAMESYKEAANAMGIQFSLNFQVNQTVAKMREDLDTLGIGGISTRDRLNIKDDAMDMFNDFVQKPLSEIREPIPQPPVREAFGSYPPPNVDKISNGSSSSSSGGDGPASDHVGEGHVSMGPTTTVSTFPVTLDLNHDDIVNLQPLSSSGEGARFDWTGDGIANPTAWVGPEDGLLAIDLGADGQAGPDDQINQAKELAFTEWVQGSADASEHTDMTALGEVFDTNGNAQLDAGDKRWNEFRVWQDANQDGQTDKGELRTLEQAGIERIALTPSPDGARTLADGTTVTGTSSYTTSDGSQGVAEDTVLRYAKNSRDGAATPSIQQLREELARGKVLQSEEALYGDAMPQYRVDERRTQPAWTPSAEDIAWSEEQGAKMMEKLGMTPMQSTPMSRWQRAKAWLGNRLGGAQSMTDVMDAPSKGLPETSELAGNAKLAASGSRFDMTTKAATGTPPVTTQSFMS